MRLRPRPWRARRESHWPAPGCWSPRRPVSVGRSVEGVDRPSHRGVHLAAELGEFAATQLRVGSDERERCVLGRGRRPFGRTVAGGEKVDASLASPRCGIEVAPDHLAVAFDDRADGIEHSDHQDFRPGEFAERSSLPARFCDVFHLSDRGRPPGAVWAQRHNSRLRRHCRRSAEFTIGIDRVLTAPVIPDDCAIHERHVIHGVVMAGEELGDDSAGGFEAEERPACETQAVDPLVVSGSAHKPAALVDTHGPAMVEEKDGAAGRALFVLCLANAEIGEVEFKSSPRGRHYRGETQVVVRGRHRARILREGKPDAPAEAR